MVKRTIGLLLMVGVLFGCGAKNVMLNLPQNPSAMEETGTLIIMLSASMNAVSVSIDGNLVVKERNTKSITVGGIRAGKIKVNVFGIDSDRRGDLDKTETLEIEPGKATAMRVQAPPYSIKRYARPVVVGIGAIMLFLGLIPAGTT
jgi:hypothetical protein